MPERNVPRPAAVYGIDIGKNIFHVVGLGTAQVGRLCASLLLTQHTDDLLFRELALFRSSVL